MSKFNVGDKVRFLSKGFYTFFPEFYPPVGTIGEIVQDEGDGAPWVRWPEGSLARNDDDWTWSAYDETLELVEAHVETVYDQIKTDVGKAAYILAHNNLAGDTVVDIIKWLQSPAEEE